MTALSSPLYIVTFSFVGRLDLRRHTGTYEMDMDRMTVSCVADDILMGQFADVRAIYEATPGQDCADVTEDVALIVARRVREEGHTLSRELKTWLHGVLGVESTAGMVDA